MTKYEAQNLIKEYCKVYQDKIDPNFICFIVNQIEVIINYPHYPRPYYGPYYTTNTTYTSATDPANPNKLSSIMAQFKNGIKTSNN
jgi:hypothetical protein